MFHPLDEAYKGYSSAFRVHRFTSIGEGIQAPLCPTPNPRQSSFPALDRPFRFRFTETIRFLHRVAGAKAYLDGTARDYRIWGFNVCFLSGAGKRDQGFAWIVR